MELSIVTTLYHSAAHVEAFYVEMTRQAEKLTGDFELIFVHDGSPDDSLERAIALHRSDPRVRVIDLSRNFGHHRAIMTGLARARGELVFLIDCDLEEDPGLLLGFHEELRRTGADVVYGVQDRRKGPWTERVGGWLFFKLFNLLSPVPLPENVSTVRLMTRRYVRGLVSHRERQLVIAGLWALTGFHQVPVLVRKGSRGFSSYSLARKLTLLVDAVTSFSDRPLVLVFYLGLGIFVAASLAGLYLVLRRLFFGELLAGWPSLIVSVWLLGGLTLFALGIIGMYVSRVFVETKRRPYTIIRAIHEDRTRRR
jgi:putative glycosyltransferase